MITMYQININIYINFNYMLLYNGSIELDLYTQQSFQRPLLQLYVHEDFLEVLCTQLHMKVKQKTKVTRMLVLGRVKPKFVMGEFGHFCIYIITSPTLTQNWAWHKGTLRTPQKRFSIRDNVCILTEMSQLCYFLMLVSLFEAGHNHCVKTLVQCI